MKPFEQARRQARELRLLALKRRAREALDSRAIVQAVVAYLDLDVVATSPDDPSLRGADALLIRDLHQVLVRSDVNWRERALLIAHEIGHIRLHLESISGCHRVLVHELRPAEGSTFAEQRVEAYGAREQAELQANVFARELLLPRSVAGKSFLAGMNEQILSTQLDLPLELVRLQLIDGMLLPEEVTRQQVMVTPRLSTDEQRTAADSNAQASLVVAGPGTGKTATLLFRIQHLIQSGVDAANILVLTFSNRAAKELQERLKDLGIGNVEEMWVGTFHSFGLEFLRKHYDAFELTPTFGVLDKLGQIELLEPQVHGAGLEAFDPLGDTLDWLKVVVETIQRLKDELVLPSDYGKAITAEESQCEADIAARRRDVQRLYAIYEIMRLGTGRLVDLGDLIMLPALALENDRERFSDTVARYKHILVDEYQDVNRASARLVKALSVDADALWVVGDPRQAIYGFRGASMRNITRFGEDFPGYAHFELSQNRRSTEEIVRLFEHTGRSHPLQGTLPLDDVSAVKGASGTRPIRLQCPSELTMGAALRESVQDYQLSGVSLRDQAVIASTHEACGKAAAALHAVGIPALYLGDIFERGEIKDLLSMLQLVVDDTGSALIRVGRFPTFATDTNQIRKLLARLEELHVPPMAWAEQLERDFDSAARVSLGRVHEVMAPFSHTDSPWDVLCSLLLGPPRLVARYLIGDDIQAVTRRMAIWQFLHFTRTPTGGATFQTIPRFLTRLRRRLRVNDDRELRLPPPEAEALDAVAVLTIHGSKGLEFECVHFVDVDARHFEEPEKTNQLVPRALLDGNEEGAPNALQTEGANRLYVALSRAKGQLVLYENRGRWYAKSVSAVTTASHLYETRDVVDVAVASTNNAPAQSFAPITVDDVDFIRFMVCPRKYLYERELGLRPSVTLPDSIRIEHAVKREMFAPTSASEQEMLAPDALRETVARIAIRDSVAAAALELYGEALLAHGRAWLGTQRVQLPKPIAYPLRQLRIKAQPHQIISDGTSVTVRFFRARPIHAKSPPMQFLRWSAREVASRASAASVRFELGILSTGELQYVTPYSARAEHLEEPANRIVRGEFEPRPHVRNCARCRHFTYCPA